MDPGEPVASKVAKPVKKTVEKPVEKTADTPKVVASGKVNEKGSYSLNRG